MRNILFLVIGFVLTPGLALAEATVRVIEPDDKTGTSRAVIVGSTPLVHTAQLLPLDNQGQLVGKGSPAVQSEKLFGNLASLLTQVRSGLDRVVKLNLYVTNDEVVPEVTRVLARRLKGLNKPAVSWVVSKLPYPEAVVAADAVAVTEMAPGEEPLKESKTGARHGVRSGAAVAILPAGARVYVSGQAEKGDLREATRRTLEKLRATLNHLGLKDSQVVQLKAFLTPMGDAAVVQKEVAAFFGDLPAPPLVLVEWRSTLPIEIELIAAAGPARQEGEVVEYLTPPGMQASPIFSRVARINRGGTIYVSGLYGRKGKSGADQVEEIFGELSRVLEKTGSDLKHLVKATYYVSDDDASRRLNELRPKFYDPRRPPAASKAVVAEVAKTGKTITIDMIAVAAGEK